MMLNREPPEEVKKQLRNEVNYGCPICGSPYLRWHHFDPPWNFKEHHNPAGMIALCGDCHAHADNDRYLPDQLREFKTSPFLKNKNVNAHFNYLRKKIFCDCGLLAKNVDTILEINNKKIIWFTTDEEGFKRLNIYLQDHKGFPVLVMKNNWWIIYTDNVIDTKCTAGGKELSVKSKDKSIDFKLKYIDYIPKIYLENKLKENIEKLRGRIPEETLEKMLSSMEIKFNPNTDVVFQISGKIKDANDSIHMYTTERKIKINTNMLVNCQSHDQPVALKIQNGSISM